jgi:endonuclease G
VPTHYFKVMLRTKSGNSGKKVQDCSADELICAGYWVANSADATPQIKSVAEIESLTGFTFFVNVPNAPKNTFTASDWE